MHQGQGQGGVHGGSFNDLRIPGADTRPLLVRFDELWSDSRYSLKRQYPKNRLACPIFSGTANMLLAGVLDSELPHGVRRAPKNGSLGSSDIVAHVDHFRAVLARLDREDE